VQSPKESRKEKNTSRFMAKEITEDESLVAIIMEHNHLERSILSSKYMSK
jgi:hypothetical protein